MKKVFSVAIASLMAFTLISGAAAQSEGTTTATLNIQAASGGVLSVQVDNVNFQAVQYKLQDQNTSATVVVRAEDTRGNGQGWNVTVRGTDFQSQSGTGANFGINNLSLQTGSIEVTEGMQPEGIALNGVGNLSAQSQKIASAQQNKGMGKYKISYPATLNVPGGTPSGDYHSTLTVTINSAP